MHGARPAGPGRRFVDLLDLNAQAARWRDDIANHRVHDVTGKVPALVFRNEERPRLRPIPDAPFNVDDLDTQQVTKTFRVGFDRNRYSVPWRLESLSERDMLGLSVSGQAVRAGREECERGLLVLAVLGEVEVDAADERVW